MTATDELRKLLDERGVEWREDAWKPARITEWDSKYGTVCAATSWETMGHEWLHLCFYSLTPEEVLAATLGGGTLTAEQVRELIAPHLHARPTFDFGHHGAVWRADFQAIADKLNATLGRGTCKPTEEDCCPICGEDLVKGDVGIGELGGAVELDPPIYHNYCPNCGAKVEQ